MSDSDATAACFPRAVARFCTGNAVGSRSGRWSGTSDGSSCSSNEIRGRALPNKENKERNKGREVKRREKEEHAILAFLCASCCVSRNFVLRENLTYM